MSLAATPLDDLGAVQDLAYAAQLALGVVLACAAAPKLRDPRGFARTVAGYGIVGERASRALAPAVIGVECLLAAALLTGAALEAALVLAAVTVLAFGAATAVNLRRGRDIECGCFGASGERISGRSLARLALMLVAIAALGGALASGEASPTTVGGLADHGAAALEYVVAIAGLAAALVIAAVWALSWPELRGALRHLRPAPRETA